MRRFNMTTKAIYDIMKKEKEMQHDHTGNWRHHKQGKGNATWPQKQFKTSKMEYHKGNEHDFKDHKFKCFWNIKNLAWTKKLMGKRLDIKEL